MKTTITLLHYLSLLILLLSGISVSAQEIGGTFDARFEEQLGLTAISPDEWLLTKSTVWTPIRASYAGGYRGAAANFLAEENGTRVAITFSAEARGQGMEVRAIVDGNPMAPGAINFASSMRALTNRALPNVLSLSRKDSVNICLSRILASADISTCFFFAA